MIFSHVLYQLSYLGIRRGPGGRSWRASLVRRPPNTIVSVQYDKTLAANSGRGACIGKVARTVQPYAPLLPADIPPLRPLTAAAPHCGGAGRRAGAAAGSFRNLRAEGAISG